MDNQRRAGAKSPTGQPERNWRWPIARQMKHSPGYAIGQVAALAVGFVILVSLWLPPNEGAINVVVQAFVTGIWLWAVQLLIGPRKITTGSS